MNNIKCNVQTGTATTAGNSHKENTKRFISLWIWLTIFLVVTNCPLYDLKKQRAVKSLIAAATTTTTTTYTKTKTQNDVYLTTTTTELNDLKRQERAKNILQLDDLYKLQFRQNVYNVSIPENSIGKTYATVVGEELLGIQLPRHVHCTVKYRIINGDKDKLFKAEERIVGDFAFLTIRTRTSNVVLNREKNDNYALRVRATINCNVETSLRQQEVETLVQLRVLDRNDLSPLFYPATYEITIPEDTPLHSSIIRVFAEDADIGINGEIYYSFHTGNDYFAIHPTSGVITLMRALRFNDYSRYELIVLANDRGSAINHYSHQATKANVSIIVEQVNLYSPEIYVNALSSFTSNVSALIYGIVRVTDRDYKRHGEIRSLAIVDGNPDGRFSIKPTPTKGDYYIQINKIAKLYTHPYIYNLTLRAEDNGIPPRASYKQVPIHFVPETNTLPVFTKEIYEISIPETSPPNMPVIRLKVSDPQMGKHALVYLEIVGGNEGGEFRMNPETGMLYTQKHLDAEKKAFYTLTVSAIDQANVGVRKQSSAKVKINIQDMNDNSPIFEHINTTIIINENELSGTYVTKVTARDKDLGENAYISYSIANINDVPFDIDHFTGVIRTSMLLDYETMRRSYLVRVRASDWGLPYRRQSDLLLHIQLHDINDNRPQFERINCLGKVLRHAPVGTDIFTLSAIDFDADDFITYRLLSGNEDGCFNLDPTTGVISIGCDLNAVVHNDRLINVSSTDGTHFSDEMSIRVRLVDGQTVAQNAQLDAALNGGYSIFECRETGVARRLAEILAASERSNAQLDTDMEETVQTNDLVLSSNRYGENLHTPEFLDFPQELKINESVPLGETIVVIKARDLDLGYNGKLIYAISDGDTDSVLHINPDNGEIQIIGYLDRERQDEYVLNITVYDQGQPQKYVSKMIPISVLDCNDNKPIYEKSMASFRLTESAINNTLIFCLNATDADLGANGLISYTLQSDLPEFYVNASTGCIRLREMLDREKQENYEFHVIARDHGMPSLSAEAVISITVEDINDNAPIFGVQDFIFKVREDIPSGTVVAAMEVTDFDIGPNGDVQFSLINDGLEQIKFVEKTQLHDDDNYDTETTANESESMHNNNDMATGLFKIDKYTGVIRTQGYLDYETRQVHNLIVSAIDRGTPSLTSNMPIVIEVIDVNENRYCPEFEDFVYTAQIRENQPIGTIVRNITARDLDLPGPDSKIAYTIRGGDGLGVFGVNDFGSIRTLSHLDAESKDSYWLTLCAQDHAIVPLSSCVQVYIEVINVNDNVPLTSRPVYYESIAEGSPANITIMQLEAIDADNDPLLEIVYNIISGNAEGFFVIDPETGELKTSERKLDRENQAEHILEISVKDNGDPPLSSTTRVVITVLDINDNTPTFDQRFYKVLVPSTVSMNESIFQVQAFDNDIDENGRITYYIKSGKGRNKFYMNPHNGFIQVTKPLDVDMEYDLNIRAEDNGTPKRQQNAKLNIIIREIKQPSPHAPLIKTLESVVDVTESDRPGFLVTLIQAVDEDGDHLWYNISAGDDRNEFYIGRDNGNILLAKPLDWETQTNYNLTICVTDGTHVAKTSLYVRVVDTNDNRPRFTQEVYHINISENIEEESVIMQLHASDDDEDKKIFYTLHAAQDPSSLHLFSIDTFSGNVLVKKGLDYEQNAHHVLIAIAKDQGTPAKRNYAKIIITVYDHNDHAPEFSSKLVQSKIPESAAIGSRLLQLYARDADSGKNAELRFAIVTGNVGNMFDIDSTLGSITLAKTLNMNEMPEYMLQVKASDLGEPSLSAQISVHIMVTMAENDPPRFSAPLEPLEMYENLPAGTFVTQVEARSSSTLFYEIVAGNDSTFFHINPSTGVIVTNNNNIDYETQRTYNLTISGTNMASIGTEHQVVIHILDVNDNAPVFTKLSYEGEVSESAETGSLVHIKSQDKPLLLLANDADMGTNAMLEFRIMDDIASEFLQIESATGAIKVKQPLDYETITHFHFEVMVFDMGKPKLYAKQNAEVNISVLNVNDCPPKFVNKELNVTLYLPTYENVIVAQVNSTDADDKGMPLSMRTIIRYDIVDGNTNKAFKIDALSGVITTCRTDDLQNYYTLRVRASDGLYSSILRVSISVESTETQGFAFRKNQYMFSAMENTTKTLVIGLVNVVGNVLHENVDYSILNPSNMFEIGHTSGAIKTTGEIFDRETQEHYELIVEAKSVLYHNNQNIIRRALAKVQVTILDANDNCPIFVNLPYYSTVSVDDTKGSVVTQVKAVDLDSFENGEVRYELKRGNGELFKIDRKSGEITLRQSIDGKTREYELIVAAYDNAITPCSTDVSVHIKVVDRSMPIFDKQFYTDTVRENIELYTALSLSVQAHSPLKRKLIYTISQGNDNELFDIDYRTAVLYVVNELDYEQQQSHELVIRATDSVSGINAEVTVSIIVEDANDCYPLIEQDNYNITLSENLLFGTQFLKINATDCDTQANSELSYFIESINGRNDTDIFYIDMNEGTMFLKNTLDYETQQNYHIVVLVKDHGTPSLQSKANVWIRVRDLNDNAPRFVEPSFSCRMSVLATRGQFVIITQAVDLDDTDNAQLKYKIVGGNELQTYSIQPQTGIITLLNMQNFTDHEQTILNVSVTDGVHTNYARVKILLLPENQNSPIFMESVYIAHLRENAPAGAQVISVQATDGDFGKYAKIQYEIATEDMHEYFSIDELTGMISTKTVFDREQRALYEMLVKAVDAGGRFTFALIKIKIEDENDNRPLFDVKEYKAVLNANLTVNSTILQVKASDLDDEENGIVRYSIDPSTLDAAYAEHVSIGAIDGYLTIRKSLADLVNERLQFFVRAIDRGKPQKHSSVPITLQIVGNNVSLPEFEKKIITLQVTESTPPGTVLHKLQVLGNYTYNFSSASKTDELLSIIYVSDTGDIILAQTLDREAQQQLHLVAQAETNTVPALFASCDIYVQVQDENDNYPSFDSNIYHVELPENMPASSSIIKINAFDKDIGVNGEIRYALENDTHSIAQIFEIDMRSGWITTLISFDREQQSEYFFDVLARDNGQSLHVSKVPVVIKISDYNDNAPNFKQKIYNISVDENARPGTVLTHFLLTDKDAQPQDVNYYIINGDAQARFQVGTRSGELYVARTLDREQRDAYDLQLVATDGKFVAQANAYITVLDVNDNVPYCLQARYSLQVNESVPIGTPLQQIQARDLDLAQNARLRYYLTGNGSDDFSIDKETGILRVARLLDRESIAYYKLEAHAQDGHELWRECSVELLIQVLDLNDNAPEFSMPEILVSIYEDAPLNTLVTKVHASDRDAARNRKLSYAFVDQQTHFNICAETGIIKLVQPLDREQVASYNISIRAEDAGEPRLRAVTRLIVNVLDINDNPPEFTMKQYVTYVLENATLLSEIARVHATSKDVGVNAEVSYFITGGNEQQRFGMHAKTGGLHVRQPLDYEKTKSYFLTVQAIDGGTPPLSQLAYVNITVIDVNDNQPEFRQNVYRLRVSEAAAIGEQLLQLVATDEDSGNFGKITYSLIRGDRFSQFHLEAASGNLSVARALDRETIGSYVLEAQACDAGEPQLCSYVQIYVSVLDINDNPPIFSQTNYTVMLQENKPLGFIVLHFNISDADEPPNAAPYTFDLRAGNEGGCFRMEPDGTMRTAARFNHLVKKHYALLIRVFDSGTPPLYTDAWVEVHVIEESQYPPVITPLEITVNSYEDDFSGGVHLGRVFAKDQDQYDTLFYDFAPHLEERQLPSNKLFNISHTNGTLWAVGALDIGLYRINVTVSDGKFTSSAIIILNVELITLEMVRHAAIIRFRNISAEDFILSHRKGFMRAIRATMRCRQKDIVLITLLENHLNGSQQLDVVLAVHKQQIVPTAEAYFSEQEIRTALLGNLELIEEQSTLLISEVPALVCQQQICEHGDCQSHIELLPRELITYATDVISFALPRYQQTQQCLCQPGYGGPRCEQSINACSTAPCPPQKQCWPADSLSGYQCICPRGYTGAYCEQKAMFSKYSNNNNMTTTQSAAVLADSLTAVSFSGKSYAHYKLNKALAKPEHLSIYTLRIRTVQQTGTLLYASGKVDYNVLEVVNGAVQYRFDLGSGEGIVSVSSVYVSDGEWHRISVERNRGSAKLTVDDKHVAQGSAPGVNSILNIHTHDVFVGAEVRSHASILGFEDIQRGFIGCMSDIRIALEPLPLYIAGGSAIAALKRFNNVDFHCDAGAVLKRLGVCGAQPCLNGGVCTNLGNNNFECMCHARFSGMRCELDLEPCASAPCLFGGRCVHLGPSNYTCICPAHLSGRRCEYGKFCTPNPCQNGGICEEGDGMPHCMCFGYTGHTCELDVDECENQPCGNGATCINEPGSFRCICPASLTGASCGDPLYSNSITSKLRNLSFEHWAAILAGFLILIFLISTISCCLAVRRHKRRNRNRAKIVGGKSKNGHYKDAQLNSLLDKKNKYSNSNTNRNTNSQHTPNATKLINLEVNHRPMSYTTANDNLLHSSTAFVNNLDILRSYGSAGDELENIPVEYQKINRTNNQPININAYNLSETELSNKHEWCNQMQLKTFSENKLNNERFAPNNRLASLKASCGKLIHVDVPNVCHPVGTTHTIAATTTAATSNASVPSVSAAVTPSTSSSGAGQCVGLNCEYPAYNAGQYHWDCSDWVRKSQNPLPDITEVPGAEIADSSSLHSNDSNESKPHSPYIVQSIGTVDPARDMTTLNEDLTSEYVDSELESCLQPFELPLIKSKSISRLNPQPNSENEDYKLNTNKVFLCHPNSYLASMTTPSETEGESSANEAFLTRLHTNDPTATGRQLSEEEFLMGNLRRNHSHQHHHHHHHHHHHARHHSHHQHNSSQSDISVHLCEIEDSELEEFLPKKSTEDR